MDGYLFKKVVTFDTEGAEIKGWVPFKESSLHLIAYFDV